MSPRGKISAALCTYNGGRYLGDQLKSIAAQTRLLNELVVCDDGSTDSTLEILREFAQSAPFPLRIYRNSTSLGPAKNFERAISLCSGDLITLSDQDDVWLPERLDVAASVLEKNLNCGGIFSDATLIDGHSQPIGASLWKAIGFCGDDVGTGGEWPKVLLKKNVVTGATLMLRASLRESVLPIPGAWMHDGWIAWMLALYSNMVALNRPLIQYRLHSSQHASIRSSSLRNRIRKSVGQTGGETLLREVSQFEALLARMEERSSPSVAPWKSLVNARLNLLHRRLGLSESAPVRVFQVLSLWTDYRKFTEGALTMARDVMFPHRLA